MNVLLGFSASSGFAKGLSVDFLSDETPASCGCFVWQAPSPQTLGKLIYQEIETNDKKDLNMKLNGEVINLTKKSSAKVDKHRWSKLGQTQEERLVGPNVKVHSRWKATKINSSDEESARATNFEVRFSIEKGGVKKEVKGAGYCGC